MICGLEVIRPGRVLCCGGIPRRLTEPLRSPNKGLVPSLTAPQRRSPSRNMAAHIYLTWKHTYTQESDLSASEQY